MKIFAGSYTKMINPDFGGTGEGVYCFDFDEINGDLSLISKTNIVNPSYLCLFNGILYTFNEVGQEESPCIYAYRVGKDGEFELLNKMPLNGDTPCHIAISSKYRCLFVSCYGSGNVLVFSLNDDGSLDRAIDDLRHRGNSVNKERQNGPHAHCVLIIDENDEVYVADLGADKIYVYEIGERKSVLRINCITYIEMPPGLGPRHFAAHFSGRYLFVVTELIPRVLMIDLTRRKIVSSIDLGVRKDIGSASAIKMSDDDANHLYVSERKGNNLFLLSYDIDKESLKLIDEIETKARTPRDFLINKTGDWLIVAGQDSDTLSIYKRKPRDGSLTLHNTLDGMSSISCLI